MLRRARWPSAPSWRSAWAPPARFLRPRDHIDTNLLQILGRGRISLCFLLPVAEILFLGAWINGSSQGILYSLLQAQGRPDVTGKIHAVEVVPFLAVLWFLTKAHGIEGAALAWTIRAFVDAAFLGWAARLPIGLAVQALPPIFHPRCFYRHCAFCRGQRVFGNRFGEHHWLNFSSPRTVQGTRSAAWHPPSIEHPPRRHSNFLT